MYVTTHNSMEWRNDSMIILSDMTDSNTLLMTMSVFCCQVGQIVVPKMLLLQDIVNIMLPPDMIVFAAHGMLTSVTPGVMFTVYCRHTLQVVSVCGLLRRST